MGALPKRRISTHRKGRRRKNHLASLPNLVTCKHCGEKKLSHRLCPECGEY